MRAIICDKRFFTKAKEKMFFCQGHNQDFFANIFIFYKLLTEFIKATNFFSKVVLVGLDFSVANLTGMVAKYDLLILLKILLKLN